MLTASNLCLTLLPTNTSIRAESNTKHTCTIARAEIVRILSIYYIMSSLSLFICESAETGQWWRSGAVRESSMKVLIYILIGGLDQWHQRVSEHAWVVTGRCRSASTGLASFASFTILISDIKLITCFFLYYCPSNYNKIQIPPPTSQCWCAETYL